MNIRGRNYKFIGGVLHKKCTPKNGCGKFKTIDNFWKRADSFDSGCKDCRKKFERERRRLIKEMGATKTELPETKPNGAEKYRDGSWWKTGRFGFHFRWNEFINDWVRADYQDYRERVL